MDERIVPRIMISFRPSRNARCSGDDCVQSLDDLRIVQTLIVFGRDAVAQHRLAAADSAEQAERLVVAVDRPQENLFVIAHDAVNLRIASA